ncbi:MAG: universal stress protein [Deltaproteobacteria bacterium]|nr:universal stress protein [Deltaproteobacteria bacterium]
MADPKKLLIAVDGSQQSLEAVSYVALNLPPADLRVNLMYIIPSVPEPFGDLERAGFFKKKMRTRHGEWARSEQKTAQEFLHETRSLLLRANFREDDVRVILQRRQVGIARDIIAEGSRGYDAVVVGRRGLSKLGDIFLGSVSYKIVQGIENTPVWVVGGDIRSKKMLLAVDGSENSRKALDYAAAFAVANDAEVTLFNVVREFRLDFLDISTPRGAEIETRIVEELERDVQGMFASYKSRLERAGVKSNLISSKYTLQSRTRAGDILKQAKEGNYGTIVMGRRGLSKVHEFFLGRVTTKVLHRAERFALWIVP